jgi:uncharacterized Zn finger protein
MKSGICPKCGSEEVYKRKSGGYTTVMITRFTGVITYYYVCAECGYVESYIEERDKLETIRKKWEHATKKFKRKRG